MHETKGNVDEKKVAKLNSRKSRCHTIHRIIQLIIDKDSEVHLFDNIVTIFILCDKNVTWRALGNYEGIMMTRKERTMGRKHPNNQQRWYMIRISCTTERYQELYEMAKIYSQVTLNTVKTQDEPFISNLQERPELHILMEQALNKYV